jgi:hypothetical protein
MPGIEVVTKEYYQRTIAINGLHGIIEVRSVASENYLLAKIQFPQVTALAQIVGRLRLSNSCAIFQASANGRRTILPCDLCENPMLFPPAI